MKDVTKYAVKRALAVWRDSSSYSGEDKRNEGVSMIALEDEKVTFDTRFYFMDTKDEEEEKVTLSDVKENLENYLARKVKNLANMLLDST